jgi:hypothetical protein
MKWISIKKRLPPLEESVLCLMRYRDIYQLKRIEASKEDEKLGLWWRTRIAGMHCEFRDGTIFGDDGVTHWMSAPNLPVENGKPLLYHEEVDKDEPYLQDNLSQGIRDIIISAISQSNDDDYSLGDEL